MRRAGFVMLALLFVVVAGARSQGAAPPGLRDPLGFAGRWTEYWGNDPEHEKGVITYRSGRYAVQMFSAAGKPWRVTDVRLDGQVLKFTQHTIIRYMNGPAKSNAIHYELRVTDASTLAASARDVRGVTSSIVWRRIGPPPERPASPSASEAADPTEAHAADDAIRPGDSVLVRNGPAPVMKGAQRLTEVENGTLLTVVKVQDRWVQVRVERGEFVYTGWIDAPRYLARRND